jgi:hypothetical protein
MPKDSYLDQLVAAGIPFRDRRPRRVEATAFEDWRGKTSCRNRAAPAGPQIDGNADGNAAELWRTAANYNERLTLKFNTQ